MYLNEFNNALHGLGEVGMLGSIDGSGPAGDWTNPGPEYPRITLNGDGTARVVFNSSGLTASGVPVKVLPQLERACGDPRGASVGQFPGLLRCGNGRAFSLMPGKTWQGFDPNVGISLQKGTAAITLGNDRRYWPDGWWEEVNAGTPQQPSGVMSLEELKRNLPPFNGGKCFGTAVIDGVQRGNVQGPCSGDPNAALRLPDGSPNPFHQARGDGGYRFGTSANPYRPWADPDHPLYGHPVIADAAPQLPGGHDPWEPIDPVLNPDPIDDGVPPISDPSRPYDPTLPGGGPIDPPPPTGGDPGSQPPVNPGDPGTDPGGTPVDFPGGPHVPPPTGDPGGPPPSLPPGDGGGVQPPAGPPPASSGASALWPLGLLAAFLLMRKR